MTSATGPGLTADELLRRLRAWPVASWQHGDRVAACRAALGRLAAAAADRRSMPTPPVPELDVTALGDQLAVLLADARAAGADPAEIDAVVAGLLRDLRLT